MASSDVVYKPWYERYPDRFRRECGEMEARAFCLNETAFKNGGSVQFLGPSGIDPSLEYSVIYPDAFPSKPPRVLTPVSKPILRRHHRFGTREICTFGPGQSRWNASLSGTAVIDEADRIVAEFAPGRSLPADDEAPEPETASYLYTPGDFFLVPPEIAAAVEQIPVGQRTRMKFKFGLPNLPRKVHSSRGVITELMVGNTVVTARGPYVEWIAGASNLRGIVQKLETPPPFFASHDDVAAYLRNIGSHNESWLALVFPQQSGTTSRKQLGWLVINVTRKRFRVMRVFVQNREGRSARVPGYEALASKKLVFVGCGSMGSKIAVAMASSGVKTFGLLDFDHIEPDNSVRHEVGVSWYGIDKVKALEDRIVDHNPSAYDQVEKLTAGIGMLDQSTNQNVNKQIYELLSSADLVVETTGDHGVSRYIHDICTALKVPQVFATVTSGAWAGEVVRVVPGQTACWLCWLSQYDADPPPGEPGSAHGVFAPGCDQPTFTGTTYEIGIVAGLASAMCTAIIRPGGADFDGNYIRWQMRNTEGKLEPSVEVRRVLKRPTCKFCAE